MRSDADFERELDNRTFALQRDLLMWRLARLHDVPDEEKQKRCLEQLHQLCDLLVEIEAFLRDQQEGVTARQKETRKAEQEWINNHSTLRSSAAAISPEPTENHYSPIHS